MTRTPIRNAALAAFVALTAAAAGTAQAAPGPSVPASGRMTFDVIRKGKDIGDYVLSFRGKGPDLTVNVSTDVNVKMPVIGVSNVGPMDAGVWAGMKCIGASIAVGHDGTLVYRLFVRTRTGRATQARH